MIDVFAHAASATVRIEFAESCGSGFHFMSAGTIITNRHVIEGAELGSTDAVAVTESGVRLALTLLAYSPADADDFAVLSVRDDIPPGLGLLSPSADVSPPRGTQVVFAGFPHGIPDLLVQQAIVSGLLSPRGFYMDGSVNGGNSGGPILNADDGSVLGVVTQRRFIGSGQLGDLRSTAGRIGSHCEEAAAHGSVEIMGINFGRYAGLMAEGMVLIEDVLQINANTGIGIGYSIAPVVAKCFELRPS